jgi:hypothetical protein
VLDSKGCQLDELISSVGLFVEVAEGGHYRLEEHEKRLFELRSHFFQLGLVVEEQLFEGLRDEPD